MYNNIALLKCLVLTWVEVFEHMKLLFVVDKDKC